jgi:hypothetical protein
LILHETFLDKKKKKIEPQGCNFMNHERDRERGGGWDQRDMGKKL